MGKLDGKSRSSPPALAAFGRIDIAVLNAGGIMNAAPIAEMTDENWNHALSINLNHTFWGMRRALQHMQKQQSGRIIAMSSVEGKLSKPTIAHYSSNKHAINGLVKVAAHENGTQGITVNAILPGLVLTDMFYETGPHHMAFFVDDLAAAQEALTATVHNWLASTRWCAMPRSTGTAQNPSESSDCRRGWQTLEMKNFSGRVAAITGAGSGIGRALAEELARSGAHLALSDINAVGLAETVNLCEGAGFGVKVTSTELDVADRDAVYAWAEQVVDEHGKVNLIFNNAGVDLTATIEGASYEDFEWLMNINFWGVVHGTKAFLPHLKATGEGHVVNISSVFGLVSIPMQSAYNAAKFGVRGFTDALRIELDIERCGVSATTIHPGGIKTNIARNARIDKSAAAFGDDPDNFDEEFDKMARTTPEKAAAQILKAVARNRRRALIGPDAVVFDLMSRLPAGLYQRILAAGARRTMAKR